MNSLPENKPSETAETTTTTGDSSASTTNVDIDTLITQAEQRGYQRGFSEAISERINRPPLYRAPDPEPPDAPQPADATLPPACTFLSGLKPTPWD